MSKNIFSHLDKFLHKIDEFELKGKPIDTYRWFRYLTFEVVSKLYMRSDPLLFISVNSINLQLMSDLGPNMT